MSELPTEPNAETNVTPVPAGAPEDRLPYWSYQDVLVLAGLALPAMILAKLLVDGAFRAFTSSAPGQVPQLLAAQFTGYALLLAALWALLRLRYDRPVWKSMGWVIPDRWVLLRCAAWGPLLALGVSLLGMILQTPDLDMPIKRFLQGREAVLLVAIFGVTLGPLCEELFFRGLFMPLVVRSLGVVAGIIVAALPFSLLHGPQYAWSWRHILLVTLAGAGFGWVRYRVRSTAAATVMHATYNLTFFIGYIFQQKDSLLRW
ncbi:MAG: CPBP family intramembrane metalloprotease [Acidobacteriales bacterium]|nr:CPBP family intramembrane metalloprotease [Terriglobales bacterium]